MGLFDIFKKNESQPITDKPKKQGKVLLAMPMYSNHNRYCLDAVVKSLKENWNISCQVDGNDDSAVLNVDGQLLAIAFMSFPIPSKDLENTAYYAYNWPNAMDETRPHTGHAIVSIMNSSASIADRCLLISKVISAILSSSQAIAVYQGSQTLLIPKAQYLAYENQLKDNKLPIPLWVYFGLQASESGNSIYTYGLKEFNKLEMEVVNSNRGLEELYLYFINISAYVIEEDVELKTGETLGYSPEQHVPITESRGMFLEGQTLKLAM